MKDNKVGSDVAAMVGVFADHDLFIESGIEMDKDAAVVVGCGDVELNVTSDFTGYEIRFVKRDRGILF